MLLAVSTMIDKTLLEELDSAVGKVAGVKRLSDAAAQACIQQLQESFVKNVTPRWWWEALCVPSVRKSYGSDDGLSCLLSLVQSEPSVVLVVTDDSDPPWVAYEGVPNSIVDVLRDCRFFEYAIAAPDASWIVFDTHLNELVIAGRLIR